MKKLIYKPLNYKNLLIRCVHGIEDKSLAEKIYENIDNFMQNSDSYKEMVSSYNIEGVNRELQFNLTKTNMLFLYSKLRDSPHSRKYYDYLLGMSSICPYCGVQISHSLDHYLPKTHFPMYSVDPHNLLPSCTDCNNHKGEHEQINGQQTLHPYFDKFSEHRYLKSKIDKEMVGFEFYLEKPPDLNDYEFEKVEFHFTKLKLSKMYSVLASKEVHSQIYQLRMLFEEGGVQSVQINLEDIYISNLQIEVNSWKTALYEELKNSDWFCSEGIFRFEYVESNHDDDLSEEADLPIPTL